MSLVISDHEVFYDAASTQHPYAGSVSAIATLVPLSLKQGDGTYQIDARGGKRFPPVSLIDGSWALTLPWPSEASPGQNPWVITRSDGTAVTGLVPEGVSGPLTVQNLVTSYGWGFVPPQTAAQVQVVTGPQGIKGDPGTAPTASANTVVAGPTTGSPAQAAPRALVAADIPALSPSQITGTAVVTSDSRLSDARTPTSHETTHLPGGSDALNWTGAIHVAGTHAARPVAASGNAGMLYAETDTGTLWRSDGSVWSQVATLTNAATQTALGSGYRTTYYPAAYGTYDPTGLVGSNAAIQAAGDAASAAGGGDIDLGYGTFLLANVIDMTRWFNVRLVGHGFRATVLKLVPTLTYNSGVLISSPFVFGNHLLDFCLDCNGSGAAIIGSQKPIIVPSSRCTIRIELCNWIGTIAGGSGAAISGTTGIAITGHHVDLSDSYIHDTYQFQTLTTTALGAAGATTAIVASTAGFAFASGSPGNQTIVIDPSVNAVSQSALTSGTTPTITPITESDNPRPGTGMTTGMRGIYPGQQLTLASVPAGTSETVTVASITASGFIPNAALTNSYAAGASITYVGATETLQCGGVNGGTSTLTFATATQLAHAGNVALVAFAPTYDAVAVIGWNNGNLYCGDIKVSHCQFERLGEDPFGAAVARRVTVADNHAIACASGFALTDTVSGDIHDNTLDASYFGQFPSSVSATAGQIWSGVFVVAGTAPTTAGVQPSNWDGLRIHDNDITGYARGVLLSGNTTFIRDAQVHDNRLNGQGVEAVYVSGSKQVRIHHNTIRNPNANGLGAGGEAGLSVAGILLLGAGVATAIDDVTVSENSIVDDRGTPKMQAGIQMYGAGGATNIALLNNRISGSTGTAIQSASMAAGAWRASGNIGYNPLSAPTAPITTPVTATWYQNTTGVDCWVQVIQSGVTGTHLYINSTASTTGAKDYGAQSIWPGMVFVPANAFIQAVFSAGTVTLGWQGT